MTIMKIITIMLLMLMLIVPLLLLQGVGGVLPATECIPIMMAMVALNGNVSMESLIS